MNKSRMSTLLTVVSAFGVIGTSIMVAKETPKAIRLLKKEEEAKGDKLTKLEVIKTVGPVYIPAIITGATTIACIFGANILNKRQQASLMSAYALLDKSYKDYRNKVNDVYGEEADERINTAIIDDIKDEAEITDDVVTFFDFNNLRYFEAPMSEVIQKTTMEGGMECYIITTPFDNTF